MERYLKRIDWVLDKLLAGTGAVAMGLLLLLAFFVATQVFARYVLSIHIRGLFVYSETALIIFPLLVAAYSLKNNAHVSVDFITSRLTERVQAFLSIPVYSVSIIFVVVLAVYMWQWTTMSFAAGSVKLAERIPIPIPLGVLGSIMLFGCLLLIAEIVRQIIYAVRFLRTYEGETKSFSLKPSDSPIVCVSLFLVAIFLGLILLVYGNGTIALAFITVVLLFSGMPVFFALGLAGAAGLYFVTQSSLIQMPLIAFQSMNTFALTALPLFVMGGLILEGAKVVDKLFKFFMMFTGRFRAAPLLVTIICGLFFCAVTGSTAGATAVVTAVVLPILVANGYRKTLSCGVIGGATVGNLIPPSTGLIVFGVMTEESIAQLFFGTMGAGVLLFTFLTIYVIALSIINKKLLFEKGQVPHHVEHQHTSLKAKLVALRSATLGLMAPVIVLGGIYLGVFTPTEGAAVMVVYGIIVSLITRTFTWQGFVASLRRSCHIAAMICCIMIAAFILSAVTAQMRIGPKLVALAERLNLGQGEVLLLMSITLLILGMFLFAGPVMMITLPVFFPLTQAVGISPLFLAVLYVFMSESGALTPPVGVNLFTISGVSGTPLSTVTLGNLPTVGMLLLTLAVVYFVPEIVTWLPSTMVK